jgi:hypothetical protein
MRPFLNNRIQCPHVHHRLVRNYKYNGEITVQSVKWLMAYPLPKYRVAMKRVKKYAYIRLHLHSNLSGFLKCSPSPTNYGKGWK